MATLTKRQKQIYDFVSDFIKKQSISPTTEEIKKHFRLSAHSTILEHVDALVEKGFLLRNDNLSRGLELPIQNQQMVQIPLLGTIAAGQPLTLFDTVNENIAIPRNKLPNSSNDNIYALKVAGNSMIDENINDGDTILVRHQSTAENGQKIVALVDGGATLKKFYKERGQIRLQPANKKMEPIIVRRGQDFHIQGIMIDVVQSGHTTFQLPEIKTIEPKYNKKLPLNQIIVGDAIEAMRKIPSESIDMAFADPPFNLNKKYGNYKDKKVDEEYIKWCEQWLSEMVRITKPTGSILVHNIPKWLIYFANHLNKIAIFKHWIAWDSMSTPLGKTLLPAHYGILFYTKSLKGFEFHELRSPHKKCRTCGEMIKDYGGKKNQINPHGTLLSDVWADLHRIRHNARRDNHPCQLPEPLLERLILITNN